MTGRQSGKLRLVKTIIHQKDHVTNEISVCPVWDIIIMFKVDGFETIKGQWRLFSFKEVNLFMLRSYVDVIFRAVRATNSL